MSFSTPTQEEEVDLDKLDDIVPPPQELNRYANAPKLPTNANTGLTHNNGVVCFQRAMEAYGMTVKTLEEEDITSEMFTTFAAHAFLLRKTDGSIYKPKSLGEYYRKAKEEIKRRFMNHPYWNTIIASEDSGSGLTGEAYCLSLAADLEKEVGREGNATAQEETSPPIYRSSLLTAIQSILRQATPNAFEDAFLVVVTYAAMGRGGEGKLMSWKSTVVDDFMQMLVSRWFEEKTIRGYPLSFFSDVDAELDIFFLANGFFMNKGLYRDRTVGAIQASRVFGKRANFATYISKLLKNHSGVTGATSRGLRRATCTVTFACRRLVEKDSNARGGWLPADNKKHYITSTVETTIPAGIYLAGHENVPEKVHFPSLPHSLPPAEWEDVMTICYEPISLPEFKPTGRLRPLLAICLASMLRYYVDVSRRYSQHDNCTVMVVVRKLRDAISKQPSFLALDKTPHAFLLDLSREVATTWQEKNMPEDTNQGLQDLVAAQSKRQIKTDAKVSQLTDLVIAIGDGQEKISHDQQKLIQTVLESRSLRSPVKSPSPRNSPIKRKVIDVADDDDDDSDDDSEEEDNNSAGGGSSSSSGKPTPQKTFLNYSSGKKISGKDVSLSSLLKRISTERSTGSILTSDFNYDEVAKVKVALGCISDEMTSNELKDLKEATKPELKLMEICTDVEDRCMKKVHDLEVEHGIFKPKEGSIVTYKDRRATTFFLGFAARVSSIIRKDGTW